MSILIVENLNFKYEKNKNNVLNNVTFALEKESITGLIGDNGSGKTTLMKLICGILHSDEGKITSASESMGVLIEEPSLYEDMSVLENLKFYCRLYGRDFDVIDQYKQVLGVEKYLGKKAAKLSLGMKQRVGLFVALICSEEFIMLDEPTNGLDPTGTRDLLTLIKNLVEEHGITFVISSHILQNLEQICDRYIMLKDSNAILFDKSYIEKANLNEVYFNENI